MDPRKHSYDPKSILDAKQMWQHPHVSVRHEDDGFCAAEGATGDRKTSFPRLLRAVLRIYKSIWQIEAVKSEDHRKPSAYRSGRATSQV